MFTRSTVKFNNLLRGQPCFQSSTKWYRMQSTATAATNQQKDPLLSTAKPYHEIPAPPMWPIVGSAWLFFPVVGRYDMLRLHLSTRHKRQLYGNVWREKLGPLNSVVSFQAEDMETLFRNEGPYPNRGEFACLKAYRESRRQWYKSTGLLILQGKEWHDLRTKVQKHLMKPKAIEAYVEPMQEVARDFVQRMCQIKDSKNEVPDYLYELYKWSLESIAYVGLDARLGCFQSDITGNFDGIKLIQSVQTQFQLMSKLEGFLGNVQFWKLFPTKKWRKFEKVSDEFSEIAFKYINRSCEELKKKAKSDDTELTLLQAMLASEGLELGGAMVTVADMLFAGIDTTSHTVGFFLYELAKNPDKQELLHQEICKVLLLNGGRLTPAVLPELKYLRASLKESLRLHPLIPVGARALDHDVVISGYRIPKKTLIVVMLQEICLDERYYKNPSQFLPERWMNKEEKPHPFSYFPFGFGPRGCVGKRLAELEITCVITEILRRFKVEYKYEDIDILTKFIATPDKPLKFSFIERN